MDKKEYLKFASELQGMIFDFVNKHKVVAACKLQQTSEDDIQWTLNLGKKYGSVNVIIESWERANYHGKVSVCSIPMKYETFRDPKRRFTMPSGCVNSFNGKFVLHARSNATESLLNDFRGVLEKWGANNEYKTMEQPYICMN